MSAPLGLLEDLALERVFLAETLERSRDLWARRQYLPASVENTIAAQSRARIAELELELASHEGGSKS